MKNITKEMCWMMRWRITEEASVGEPTQAHGIQGKSNRCYKPSTVIISLLSLSPSMICCLGGLLLPDCLHQFHDVIPTSITKNHETEKLQDFCHV